MSHQNKDFQVFWLCLALPGFPRVLQVFGTCLVDAMMCQGTLITMYQGGFVRIHSLDDVIRAGRLFAANLHEYCPHVQDVVGTYPTGLPLNLKLSSEYAQQ